MAAPLELPAAYSLHALERVDSVMDEAWRLIAGGAEEGTLVWARTQTAGRRLRWQPWPSPPGNLYCALVLRPETAAERDPGLALLALRACGAALGELAPPMTDLKYAWPDRVVVNAATAAAVALEDDAATGSGALVLGTFVNVNSHPGDQEPPATNLAAEGFPGIGVEELLTALCRHFAAWAVRWSEQGLDPALRQIQARLAAAERVPLPTGGPPAAVNGIEPDGGARIEIDGRESRLSLAEYFRLGKAHEASVR